MLLLPALLEEMLATGRWPRDWKAAHSWSVAEERVRSLAPEEKEIFLRPPPFISAREQCKQNPFWFDPSADPGAFDLDLAMEIGDFGLGSDAPILLDYRASAENPCVIRLRWSLPNPNRWVLMAPSFPHFVEALGL